jgi:hypothetical protein
MSLTGTAFQTLTIAVAVLVTAGAVLLWNRVRGPRVVRVLSRSALLLAGYALSALDDRPRTRPRPPEVVRAGDDERRCDRPFRRGHAR